MCRLSSHTAALALLWAALSYPWEMTLTLPRPDVTAPAYITLLFLTSAAAAAGLPCFNLVGGGDFSTCTTTLPKTFDGRADASFVAEVLGSWEEKTCAGLWLVLPCFRCRQLSVIAIVYRLHALNCAAERW